MTGNTARAKAPFGRRQPWLTPALLLLVAVVVLAAGAPQAEAAPLDAARAAAKDGDWAKAAELFAQALRARTSMRDAAIGLTEAAVKARRVDLYAEAEEALFTLRDRNQRDWEARIALGEISLAIAATKTDSLALRSYHAEALRNFTAARKGLPASEAAAAGVARTLFETADFQGAVRAADEFLATRPESAARALYWKGQALYTLARDEHGKAGGTYPLQPTVESLFRKAQGAYLASVQGDPASYDAWMQYAYASQYLGEREAAMDGYKHALALDPESVFPLRGVEALNKHDPEALSAVLRAIVEEHPEHPQALFFLGYNRLVAKDWAAAIEMLERFTAVAKAPAEGWYWLGQAHEGKGDEAEALKAYEKTLKAAPDHVQAAWALDQRLIRAGARDKAAGSIAGAEEVIAAYQPLLELAPRNAFVRNNLAFTLREAYVANQGSEDWIPILRASVRFYVEASSFIGEWDAQKERTLAWGQRYALAQIISDTGLVFQFYEPTRDPKKAETYYDRALEFTDNGYRDAFNNLAQLLTEQKRWRDLYELADACSESIRTETEQPDEATRSVARRIMQKLKDERKVR